MERVIIKAIKNDISIYAIHTNLDNVYNGVNSKIAEILSLKNCQILKPKSKLIKQLVVYCPSTHASFLMTSLHFSSQAPATIILHGTQSPQHSRCSVRSASSEKLRLLLYL